MLWKKILILFTPFDEYFLILIKFLCSVSSVLLVFCVFLHSKIELLIIKFKKGMGGFSVQSQWLNA